MSIQTVVIFGELDAVELLQRLSLEIDCQVDVDDFNEKGSLSVSFKMKVAKLDDRSLAELETYTREAQRYGELFTDGIARFGAYNVGFHSCKKVNALTFTSFARRLSMFTATATASKVFQRVGGPKAKVVGYEELQNHIDLITREERSMSYDDMDLFDLYQPAKQDFDFLWDWWLDPHKARAEPTTGATSPPNSDDA